MRRSAARVAALMVVKFTLGSNVCWRCQLRQRTSRAAIQDARKLGTVGSRQARRQHNLTTPDPTSHETERSQRHTIQSDLENRGKERELPSAGTPAPRPRLSEYPLGRLHGYLGKLQREDIQDLNVGALGQQAKVIVLRDAGVKSVSHRPPTRDIDPESEAPVDILKRLDDERGLVGQDEVERNIEELRPPPGQLLSWKEFQHVEEQLNEGFTNSQLTKYVQSHQSHQSHQARQIADVADSSEIIDASTAPGEDRAVRVSAWMPGISNSTKHFEESPVRGYTSELSFTQKQRLVVRLLRQCWHVEVHEVVGSIGEIEVDLPETDLELLLHGSPSPLEKISNEHITESEDRIDVFRTRHVIRIAAMQSKAILIAGKIRDMLNNVHNLNINLDMLRSQQRPELGPLELQGKARAITLDGWPSVAVLADLTKITGALLKFVSPTELSIASINSRPRTGLSSSSDAARRLLVTSSKSLNHASGSLAAWNLRSQLLPVEYDQTESLPWSNRMHKWKRWTGRTQMMPISPYKSVSPQLLHDVRGGVHKQTDSAGSVLPEAHDDQYDKKRSVDYRNRTQDALNWDDALHTTTNIVPGYVLQKSSYDEISSFMIERSPKHTHHMFVPGQQRISQLFVSDHLPESILTRSIHLRFLPSPWLTAMPQPASKLPPIQICLSVNGKDGSTALESVQADLETNNMDFMLPLSALDLRFQQHRRVHATSVLPNVQQFLQDSQLSLKGGALVTPPSLHFPIEPHLLNSNEGQVFEAEYLFAGLEYRNAFSSSFEGWKLTYTSIEGGKADGRRTEVSLCPSVVGAMPDGQALLERKRRGEDLSKHYIASAFNLVKALETNEQTPDLNSDMRRVVPSVGTATPDFPYFIHEIEFDEDLSLKKSIADER